MIRNEHEYREAVRRIVEEEQRIRAEEEKLREAELSPEQVKRATDPVRSFHLQLTEEVEAYERLKRGEFGEITNLSGIGRLLVAARIARGLSQRELAERLGVHESQVSRDERNEYHNVTLDRAARILDALEIQTRTTVTSADTARNEVAGV